MVIGSFVISLTALESEASGTATRSRTCVAPRDLTYASLRADAVVMIGEKPESFASWIAGDWCETISDKSYRSYGKCIPCCPTEDEPPIMRIG